MGVAVKGGVDTQQALLRHWLLKPVGAVLIVVDLLGGTHDVRKLRIDPEGYGLPDDESSGSEVSLRNLLEHVDIQGLVRDHLFQTSILPLELFQTLHFR